MTTKLSSFLLLVLFINITNNAYTQANTTLSNLVSPTSVNQSLLPSANNAFTLGSTTRSWRFLYIDSQIYIKDVLAIHSRGTGNFFTGQSAGNLTLTGSYNTAFGQSALPVLTSGGSNVALGFSAMYSNTTGINNTATGVKALNFNTTGRHNTATGYRALYSNTVGFSNVAIGINALNSSTSASNQVAVGDSALFLNTTGAENVGVGSKTLYSNVSGYYNTAAGFRSLYSNINGFYNSATGYQTLYSNTTGSYNTVSGNFAMRLNNNGSYNTAFGSEAMYASTGSYNAAAGYQALYYNQSNYNSATGAYSSNGNTTGSFNTGTGFASLYLNTTGSYNTGAGAYAAYSNVSGSGNTAVGYFADFGASSLINATSVGYSAVATASNQVMLGNSSVISVKAAGSVVIYSDGRFKKDLQQNVPGLQFIKQLRPVTYHYDIHGINDFTGATEIKNKAREIIKEKNYGDAASIAKQEALDESSILTKEKKLYTGFVAQEVEAAARKLNYDFSGVYAPQNDKDIYGLSYSDFVVPLVKAVQELSAKNDQLQQDNLAMAIRLEKVEALLKLNINNANISDGSLEQNIPNPAKSNTTIAYTLPSKFSNASIVITDAAGKLLKTVNVSGSGRGMVNLNTAAIPSGTYNYTLFVDTARIDSKQLVIAR
jgi:trimeric autotransporter adhesin